MSSRFVITGGHSLSGVVPIHGSKNAALPLIAAGLLTEEPCILENIPAIADVETMLALTKGLGVAVDWDPARHRLEIRAAGLRSATPDPTLTRKLRGSILLSGALLGRLREAHLAYPGGDAIGARPLKTHIHALEELGARIHEDSMGLHFDGRGLSAGVITLEEPSVTATESAVLAAVRVPGKSVIHLAAGEPHVQELVNFLRAMGANIRWSGLMELTIEGVSSLHGAAHRLNPDELEISAFAALAAATRSELRLENVKPRYLDAVLLQFKKMGVPWELKERALLIHKPTTGYKSFRVQAGLYPKLGSDHIPPFAVLATQADGTSLIHDWLYENRFRYLPELQKMGANCTMLDPHRAFVTGPTKLIGSEIVGSDIRAGMTLVIAALVAEGRSTVHDIEHIDRGYENLEGRLGAIGASIERYSQR